jgi:hypothetical protein
MDTKMHKKLCDNKIMPIVIILSFAILVVSINGSIIEKSFAHDFSSDESVHFLTIVEKIRVESELAVNSTGKNIQSSAQIHANNALKSYDSHTNEEISERNERIANELNDTLNQLLEESTSNIDKSQIDKTVETINAILEEAVSTRIDEEQLNNSTIQALVFASIVDSALQNYGEAFNIGIDLTNVSNMNRHATTNDAATTIDHNNQSSEENRTQMNILNSSSYESALAFSEIALNKFYNTILTSPLLSENDTKTQSYLKKLETGLHQLTNGIKNKEDPMEVMQIVHIQIHPNLQVLFNLNLN